jgi:hypothetical protein
MEQLTHDTGGLGLLPYEDMNAAQLKAIADGSLDVTIA